MKKYAKNLNASFRLVTKQKKISYNTVKNYLKTSNWGSKAYKMTQQPMMSQKNIDDRMKFGDIINQSGHLSPDSRGQKLRRHVLWTDESPILLHPPANPQNMPFKTDNKKNVPHQRVPKYEVKIMVGWLLCSWSDANAHCGTRQDNH